MVAECQMSECQKEFAIRFQASLLTKLRVFICKKKQKNASAITITFLAKTSRYDDSKTHWRPTALCKKDRCTIFHNSVI